MTTLPQRKSPRLQSYDYGAAGAYFITICTHHRLHLFGAIDAGVMSTNKNGQIAELCWNTIPTHYLSVSLDAFVVMPNHVHGIIILDGDPGGFKTLLGRVVNAYKGAVTARIREQDLEIVTVWQTRYHDHIIRNEQDLERIRAYIENNPSSWDTDTFFTP